MGIVKEPPANLLRTGSERVTLDPRCANILRRYALEEDRRSLSDVVGELSELVDRCGGIEELKQAADRGRRREAPPSVDDPVIGPVRRPDCLGG